MFVKKSVITALAVVLLCSMALAANAANWIAVNSGTSQQAQVRLVNSSRGGLTIAATMPGLEKEILPVERTGAKGEAFAQLTIPGQAYTGELGKPKMPMITAVLDAPIGAEVTVNVNDGTYREYKLSALGIDARIVPALPSVPKLEGAKPQFMYDAATYATDAMYPGRLADVEDNSKTGGLARGHRLVTVQLYPVQYNPATGTLRVYSDIKADVRIIGGDYAKSANLVRQDYSRDWESFIQRMTLNYDASLYGAKDSLINLPIYYDIFYGNTYAAAAQRLAAWKTQKGYKVRANSASGWTAAQINDSIRLRTPKATYVAVISDPDGSDPLPASATGTSSGDQTDLYYAETDESGYLPDLFNARISVKTAAEADIVINKLINYEHASFGAAGTAWLKRATLIAGYDASYQTLGMATNAYCKTALDRYGYTVDTLVMANGEGKTRIVPKVNAGCAWTIYTAHGGQDCWCLGGTYWYANTLNTDLTNQDMYTMPIGHCCLAGDYQWTGDCFGETWVRLGNKGGVSYYGSVPSTYWDEDDWLQRRYFDAIYDSIPGTPGLQMNETGRFTRWGQFWIENHTASTMKQYYFEAYHVFNDPSMDFWTDVPHTLTVTHAPSVAPSQGNFAVNVKEGSTNLANALVCGWVRNRVGQQWSAYTDASGNVTLPAMPTTPGDTMLVTVTRHNFGPYEGQALVIVPATVTIAPDSVVVNTPTPVTVTVAEPGTGNPVADVRVTIGGWGVSPALADTTDASGVAHFNVNAPYGENLNVIGRKVGEAYDMFQVTLRVVGAANLTTAGVTAAVADLGLNGIATPDYEAQFTGTATPAGFNMLITGCGLDLSGNTAGGSLQLNGTPTALGTVTAAIAKSGYNIFTTTFPCRTVYGTLAGQVTEQGSGTPVSGVKLGGWVSGADTTVTPALFHVTTNGTGNYTVPDSLVVGRYDIYASKFGYIDTVVTPMVIYGANTCSFPIQVAPSGTVSGTVMEQGTGTALYAAIKVYRADDHSLYATVYSDTLAGGSYSAPGLPYFNYSFVVTSYHHKKITRVVTVSGAAQTQDFAMQPTAGDILVINDDDGAKGERSKVTGYDKRGNAIVVANSTAASKTGESAAQMAAMLAELGYSVTQEASSATNPATWSGYDALVWSDGRDINPLSVAAYRTSLINYVTAGGKLLLEGGEVGYDCYGDAAFASTVMHGNAWHSDSPGALTLQQAGHPLATTPNALPASLAIGYTAYGDQDAITPSNGGIAVYGTTNYAADGGIIAYDAGGDPNNGNIVYFAFNFNVLADSGTRAQVLENSIEYLLRPNTAASGSVSGTVTLGGQPTHEGVTVAIAGYPAATTNAAGAYQISNIFDGTYVVTASKENYTTGYDTVTVSGGALTGIDFTLQPVSVSTYGNTTPQAIPDNNSTGIWSYITVPAGKFAVSDMRVYLDISHTYIGDLHVALRGPGGAGDSITLHNRTGSGTDNIIGWYPTELAPAQSLGYFTGHDATGQWGLHVADLASVDTGTLNEWRLEFTHATGVAGPPATPGQDMPTAYSLNQARPNPFKDQTQIQFGLPVNATTSLAVYNIAGQRVATLIDGPLTAGYHTVTWNGRAANGQRVSGGIYICRLSTPDHQETRRLVYIR